MCEFAPARLAREAQWSLANRMLARPSCPALMVLATFAETKVARSPGRRAEKDMDVVLHNEKGRAFYEMSRKGNGSSRVSISPPRTSAASEFVMPKLVPALLAIVLIASACSTG